MAEWRIINVEEKPNNIQRQEFKKPQSDFTKKLHCNVVQFLCEKRFISGPRALDLVHISAITNSPTVIYKNSLTEWTAKVTR